MEYLKGIWFNLKHPKSPEFVKGNIRIKVKDFIDTLQHFDDEYITLDLLESREQKGYLKINTFQKTKQIAQDLSGTIEF